MLDSLETSLYRMMYDNDEGATVGKHRAESDDEDVDWPFDDPDEPTKTSKWFDAECG